MTAVKTEVKQTQQKLLRTREKIKQLYELSSALVQKLQGTCDHSLVAPWDWEHDNGYGRQSMIKGQRCLYCGWVDWWNRGTFRNPDELST